MNDSLLVSPRTAGDPAEQEMRRPDRQPQTDVMDVEHSSLLLK
jgi:hypothetical protein